MKKVIHILGASGSGTTTLGKAISDNMGYSHLDSDDYFWFPTDPKEGNSRRQRLLQDDIKQAEKCVISGSFCGWGDIFIPLFDLVIFVEAPTEIRIERLKEREYRKFGDRIMPGGDMYNNHIEFIEWAGKYDTAGFEQRSRIFHMDWLKHITCPIINVDGTTPLNELVKQISEIINN